MDLDDQLAALAAGELDEETARALRARAASDPAVGRRLARLEELEGLLRGWVPPALSDEAAGRLDTRLQAALDDLGDGPLAAHEAAATGSAATAAAPRSERDRPVAAAAPAGVSDGGNGEVVDLATARQRRGLPPWASGLAIAAALAAVVGTGVLLGGFPSGSDTDMLADDTQDAPVEEGLEADDADGADEQSATTMLEEEPADAGADTTAEAAGGSADDPQRVSGVVLAEGELLRLAEDDPSLVAEPQGGDGEQAEQRAASAEACVGVALERDTAAGDDRRVTVLADGEYAGRAAAFVVVRTDGDPGLVTVLAYDPTDCSLLGSEETSG